MRQIFVFAAGDDHAQKNLHVTITAPAAFDRMEAILGPDETGNYRQLYPSGEGFYAWGAVPGLGEKNPETWKQLARGDFVFAFYKGHINYVSTVLAKLRNQELARELWEKDKKSGQTWEYMYLLSKPKAVRVPLGTGPLAGLLGTQYRQFVQLPAWRVKKIHERFETTERFVEQVFNYSPFDDRESRELAEAEAREEAAVEQAPINDEDSRRRVMQSIVRRRGQGRFRSDVLRAYGGRCAVTGCTVEAILEAAHIVPYRNEATNQVANGILMRSDIHTLFDLGKLRITLDFRIELAADLFGSDYWRHHGQLLSLPTDRSDWPSAAALAYRWPTAEEAEGLAVSVSG
jgi:hypothetical protein